MFWFFGHEACGISVPQPGIKPAPLTLGGEGLTTGPPGMLNHPDLTIVKMMLHLFPLQFFFSEELQKSSQTSCNFTPTYFSVFLKNIHNSQTFKL